MQDEIKIIATQGAVDSLDKLQTKIEKLDTAFLTLVSNFEKGVQPSKLSDFKTAIDNEKLLTEQLKNQAKEIEVLVKQNTLLTQEKVNKNKIEKSEIELQNVKAKNDEKEAKNTKAKSNDYLQLVESYKKAQTTLKNLILESEKAGTSSDKFAEKIKNAQQELVKLNNELLSADHNTKQYKVGASSLATPILEYAKAQEKATKATKEANAEKAKSNAMISKQMTGQMVESVNSIGKPSESLKRMNDYYRGLEKTSAQEAKAVLANENLNRAYVQLTANREKAKQKLQDYISEETRSTAEIRKAQKEFDILNKKVAQADKAVGRFSDANRKINGLSQSVGNLMAAFGVATGLNLAVDIVKGIYTTTKALQSMDLALKMVSETEQEYAKNKVFITEVSERWGLEVKTLQQTYTQFYTASKGLLSDNAIKETFEGIAKAGSVMGLSLEQQQATFYAIDQMMSKGTVTAEELKKQLGNAMPGAIKAAAMAYKDLHPQIKTIQEAEKGLYADMKKGAIDSATYVPLIAKNFQILYGIESLDSVNTRQSAQNRLQNSWTEWVKTLSSSNSTTNKAVELINFLSKNLSTLINFIVKGGTVLGVYLGVTKTLNYLTTQSILLTEAYSIAKSVLNKRMTAEVVLTQREIALRVLNTAGTTAQTTATIAQTSATEVATVATNKFNLALLRNPLVAVIALITAGVTAYLLLRDSTDDATTSLIKYEQAKRNAEKEAVKEVGGISNKENRLKARLELEGKELLNLRKIQKTATDDDLRETNNRIKAKESEIKIIKERLRLEGINVKETSKKASDKAYISANKTQAERDSLQLKKLDKEDELEKAKKFINTKEGIANYNTTKSRIEFLKNEIKTIEDEIRIKNIEITKQNKIFNELRPNIIGKGQNETKQETQEQKDARLKKEKDEAERQARLNEDALKSKYEAELKGLELTKDTLKREYELKKGSIEKQIELSQRLALAEKEIEDKKTYEAIRRSKVENKGNKFFDFKSFDIGADKENLNKTGDIIQGHTKRVSEIFGDAFKKQSDDFDYASKTWDAYINGFKLTPEQEKDLEEFNKKIKDELEASFRVFNAYAGDFADKSGFRESFDFLGQVNPETGKTMFQSLFGKDGEAEASDYFLAVTTIAQDAYNLIESLGDQKHQRELARLEQQYSLARENAEGFEEAQKRIDKEYAKRKEQLERKEFERKKKLNMVNIVMDTAQAIMAVVGKTGAVWMIPVIAALGLTQLGIVANQKMPAYKDGTLNHKGGLALVNDGSGSNYQETIVTPDGTLIRPKERNVVMDLPQGTQVYNHEQFQRHLNNISQEQVNHTVVNGGISFSEMDNLLGKHIASQTRVSNQFSGGELVEFVNKNGNIIKRTANRGNGIGVKFS